MSLRNSRRIYYNRTADKSRPFSIFFQKLIRLVTADGKIDEEELAFLNDALGFDYKAEELEELYKNDGDRIDAYFETELDDSLAMIKGINEKLAESFKNLLVMVGKIVVESDGVVTEEEKGAAQKLIEALDK